MDGVLAPWHWAILMVVILLVFGPRKLPELGNSLGKSISGFKKGLQEAQQQGAQDEVTNHFAESQEVRESARPESISADSAAGAGESDSPPTV
jgi:sec-independent protein translocase protein TatA